MKKGRNIFLTVKCLFFAFLLYMFPFRFIETDESVPVQYGDICVFMRGTSYSYDSVLLSEEGQIMTGEELAEKGMGDIRIKARMVLLIRLKD